MDQHSGSETFVQDTEQPSCLASIERSRILRTVRRPSHSLFSQRQTFKFPQHALLLFSLIVCLAWLSPPIYAAEQLYHLNPSNYSFLNFNKHLRDGKTQAGCWNATTFQDITASDVDDPVLLLQPIDPTIQQCQDETELTIKVLQSSSSSSSSSTPFGWEHIPGEAIQLEIRGSLSLPTSIMTEMVQTGLDAAFIIQLCPVGIGSVCPPLVPIPPPSTEDRRRRLEGETSSTDYLVRFEYFWITQNDDKVIQKRLKFRPSSPGIYSILGSLVVFTNLSETGEFNIASVQGVSVIPFSSSGREQFILVHTSFDEEKQGASPAVVDKWASIIVMILSVVGGLILLSLLLLSIYYRNAQVFELTQGKFLIAMLFCGLIATSSLFLLGPSNHLYCKLHQPMINLPMSIMFAILMGRMWRIRAIISPLLLLTLDKKEHWTSKFVSLVEKMTQYLRLGNNNRVSGKNLRRTISDRQLLVVIIVLCIPQVIVQILIAAIGDQGFQIDYGNRFFPDGYAKCSVHFFESLLGKLAVGIVSSQCVGLLILAGSSRDLPSLFNETQNIWMVAVVTFVMTMIGTLVVALTYAQSYALTTQHLMLALLGGVTVVHTCVQITWPKIVLARKGTKIAVTKLIAAHNMSRQSHDFVNVKPPRAQWNSMSNNASVYGGFPSSATDSKAPQREQNTYSGVTESTTSGQEPTTNVPTMGDRVADLSLSTLREEDEPATVPANDPESQDQPGKGLVSSDSDDGDDDNSTGSSVVMTMRETTDLGMGLPQRSAQLLQHSASISSLRVSQASALDNGAKWGGIGGLGRGRFRRSMSHRPIFQTRASRASILTLEVEASVPPTLTNARSDSVVPNRGWKPDSRPALGGNNRVQSQNGNANDHSGFVPPSPGTPWRRNPSLIPLTVEYNPNTMFDIIHVEEDAPPPRRLLLRMIDVERRLTRANKAVLSGLGLSVEDWEGIRDACTALGEVFVTEVRFDWEPEQVETPSHELPLDVYSEVLSEEASESFRTDLPSPVPRDPTSRSSVPPWSIGNFDGN